VGNLSQIQTHLLAVEEKRIAMTERATYTVYAFCYPHGIPSGPSKFMAERAITDDLPAEVIGECVTEAVHKAWKSGFDPAIAPFQVIVKFRADEKERQHEGYQKNPLGFAAMVRLFGLEK
jgi:hypothetical protein